MVARELEAGIWAGVDSAEEAWVADSGEAALAGEEEAMAEEATVEVVMEEVGGVEVGWVVVGGAEEA